MLKYKSKMHIEDIESLYDEIDLQFEQFLKVLQDTDVRYSNINNKTLEGLYVSFCYGFLSSHEKLLNEFKQVH